MGDMYGVSKSLVNKVKKRVDKRHPLLTQSFVPLQTGRHMVLANELQSKFIEKFIDISCPGYKAARVTMIRYLNHFVLGLLNKDDPL